MTLISYISIPYIDKETQEIRYMQMDLNNITLKMPINDKIEVTESFSLMKVGEDDEDSRDS